MKRIATALLFTLVLTASAEAQICGGSPSFAQAPYQAGVSAAFREGAQSVGGRFAAGSSSLFAGGALAVLSFSDLDATQTNVSAFAGTEFRLDQDDRIFICPVGIVSVGVGPDVGDADVSTFGLEGGGSVGVIAHRTQALTVVPTFGLSAAWRQVSLEAGGLEADESDAFGIASLGVGFILNERVGIRPSLSIPFSVADSDVAFSVDFTFSFGQ